MCGIVGVLGFDGHPVEREVLGQMTAALAHRGPDGRGLQLVTSGAVQVGLGHTRLKIIDLSEAAAQPMANDDGSVWVVFNGEMYNYRELRATLQRQGQRFRTASDTEVILRLYERMGDRCIDQLDGMFAFAIWDARQQRLLVARDRVGKKPLFYYATPSLFAFASEIKALMRHPEIAAEVDAAALPAFFLYGYVPTPATFYRGIWKLPAGHLLHMGADRQMRLEAYWDVPVPAGQASQARSEPQVMSEVRERLAAAVRRRLIADVPLGAFLSGGIDSSIIVGEMSRLMPEPVRTFSIGFAGDPRFDETVYARLVSQRFRTLHTEFIVEPSAVDLIDRLVWHHDGPFGDSSAVPTYILSRLTREHVTVALAGDGGDELFAGYLRFSAALLTERIPGWARQAIRLLGGALPATGGPRSWPRRVQKFAGSVHLPFHERFSRWVSLCYGNLPQLLPGYQDHGRAPAPLALLAPHLRRCRDGSPLGQLLYLNFKTYLLDDLLVKMDRCSMAHGLETRSPFLDRDLVEYVFALPDRFKLRWGRTKYLLRRAYADLLPGSILRRGKQGFGAPFGTWFRSALREYLIDRLLSPQAKLRAHLDQSYLRRCIDEHLRSVQDHSLALWAVLTFESWLQQLPSWRRTSVEPVHAEE